MNQWHYELALLRLKAPHYMFNFIKPYILFLPLWWPVKCNAWAYAFFIFIGPGLRNAPKEVQQYIIGHEYGHIYCKHTFLHLVYWLAISLLGVGIFLDIRLFKIASIFLVILITWSICSPNLAKKREFEADAVALRFFGPKVALTGSLWMANKAGTISHPFRIHRLERLGWRKSFELKNHYRTFMPQILGQQYFKYNLNTNFAIRSY